MSQVTLTTSELPTPTAGGVHRNQIALDRGAAAFSRVWKAWVSQFTQPQLLKLSETYLGARQLHSSQMSGFSLGKLREPAPRVFLAAGYLNIAHARSLGFPPDRIEKVRDIGHPPTLPGALRHCWEGRQPLLDADGIAMGPTGLFEAFTGLRELPAAQAPDIDDEEMPEATDRLGAFLRHHLSVNGVDWLADLPRLKAESLVLEALLMRRPVGKEQLKQQFAHIATLANTTVDALREAAGLQH